MTIEHDAHGMPVAVSREYAARCELLRQIANNEFAKGVELVVYVSPSWYMAHEWIGAVSISDFENVMFSALISQGDPVRILLWRDHRGEDVK